MKDTILVNKEQYKELTGQEAMDHDAAVKEADVEHELHKLKKADAKRRAEAADMKAACEKSSKAFKLKMAAMKQYADERIEKAKMQAQAHAANSRKAVLDLHKSLTERR